MRGGEGLAVLVQDLLLSQAASRHAQRMFEDQQLSHDLGGNPGQRLDDLGYRWATYGENIAWGQRSVEEVVNDWLSSAGHRFNIMNRTFIDAGFARCQDYWCLILALKQG